MSEELLETLKEKVKEFERTKSISSACETVKLLGEYFKEKENEEI